MAFYERVQVLPSSEPKLLILYQAWELENDEIEKADSLADVLHSFGMRAPFEYALEEKKRRNKVKKQNKAIIFDKKKIIETFSSSVSGLAKWLQCITFQRIEEERFNNQYKHIRKVPIYSTNFSCYEHLEKLKVSSLRDEPFHMNLSILDIDHIQHA